MAALQGNDLVYKLVTSLIMSDEHIYDNIPRDKLREYIMYNIKPFESIILDGDSEISMFKLKGNRHEYDYALWDDDSNRIIYTSYDSHDIADVIRDNNIANKEMVRIELIPKGAIDYKTLSGISDNEEICFHKELINCCGAFVEDYMPTSNKIKLTMYDMANYTEDITDMEEEFSTTITSHHKGFVSSATEAYGIPYMTIEIKLVEKNFFMILVTDFEGEYNPDIIPYKEGDTLYQVYYDLLASWKFFINKDALKKKI